MTITVHEVARLVEQGVEELLAVSDLKEGDIFVLGCSTSEIVGSKIGANSNLELGVCVVQTLQKLMSKNGIFLAVQGCEHINRALVVEEKIAEKNRFPIVSVVPSLHAGGACTVAAYQLFDRPVMVEHIQAQLGMDIGDTFIGMHVQHVQIPVRTSIDKIGRAHTTFLRWRPKLIGGPRAEYANLI